MKASPCEPTLARLKCSVPSRLHRVIVRQQVERVAFELRAVASDGSELARGEVTRLDDERGRRGQRAEGIGVRNPENAAW